MNGIFNIYVRFRNQHHDFCIFLLTMFITDFIVLFVVDFFMFSNQALSTWETLNTGEQGGTDVSFY